MSELLPKPEDIQQGGNGQSEEVEETTFASSCAATCNRANANGFTDCAAAYDASKEGCVNQVSKLLPPGGSVHLRGQTIEIVSPPDGKLIARIYNKMVTKYSRATKPQP